MARNSPDSDLTPMSVGSNVVSIHGGPLPSVAAQPRGEIVDMLAEMLERAKTGALQSVAIAATDPDGSTIWCASTQSDSPHSLVGALEMAKAAVVAHALRRFM